MSIRTSRANEVAQINFDITLCNNCGLCAEVCKGAPLSMIDGKLVIDQNRVFGCIGCGQCMSVCPRDCIKITGRDISFEDIIPLQEKEKCASYEFFFSNAEKAKAAGESLAPFG